MEYFNALKKSEAGVKFKVNVIEFTPDPDVMIGFEYGVDGCEVMLCTCDRYRITIIHISIFNFLAFNSIEV
jgi:hypothetical protein